MASQIARQGAAVGKGRETTLAALILLERALKEKGVGACANKSPIADSSQTAISEKAKTRRPRNFTLHLGANLRIPGVENLTRVAPAPPEPNAQKAAAPAADPFAGLPLYALAEYLGDRVMPALEAAKEEQKKMKREAKLTGRDVPLPEIPYIPPMLPVTRWASNEAQFRSTLVVEDGARQKARLSWYHPDDTMVPREWFSRGLLEDLKYFNPFGLGSMLEDEGTMNSSTRTDAN